LAIVLLVYYWAQDLTGKKAPAFLAALFFGVAPTYAGSGGGDGGAVAWITAVNRLLATLFFLVSLFLLQRYLKGGRADHSYPTHPGLRPSRRLAAASLGAFLLAILSDEAVAAFMPILALYAWLFYYWPRRDVRGFLLLMAPFAIFALLALSSLYYVQSGRPYLETTDYKLGWHVARNFWIYLGRFAFPFRAGSPWWDSWWLIHRVGGVLLGVLGLYFLVRGPRQARFLVLWFPVALLPFLPWVPWTPSRYTYVAAIPFFLGLALLAWWAYERASRLSLRWATLGGAALVAVALVIASALTVRSNNGFAVRALGYQVLVRELQQGLSSVPTQSRVYIIGGPWTHKYDNRVWLPTIAETLYGRKVFLKNLDQVDCAQLVAPQQGVMEAGWPLFAVFRYRNGDLELTTLESLGCPARATSRGP
ncbi:MAG TPA: hypothetical protein VI877_02525, partial [Dehalococcoidia bacterium]|nr:hypothetical protein [Dehalococcoidia bacterium]